MFCHTELVFVDWTIEVSKNECNFKLDKSYWHSAICGDILYVQYVNNGGDYGFDDCCVNFFEQHKNANCKNGQFIVFCSAFTALYVCLFAYGQYD